MQPTVFEQAEGHGCQVIVIDLPQVDLGTRAAYNRAIGAELLQDEQCVSRIPWAEPAPASTRSSERADSCGGKDVDGIAKVTALPFNSELEFTKPRASMPTLKKSSSANSLTVCESRAAIKLQSVVLRRTVSLPSISSNFRRVASSDFLSRTSSVVSASSNTTSVMMSVLQGAKIHTLSACQSADTLMPSNLPLSVALTGKVASLLPTVPDSSPVWEAGKDAKESNKSAEKSTSADTGAKYLCDDSDSTVHGWSQEDDPKRPSRSKLSCLKLIALRLCFARNKSDADNS